MSASSPPIARYIGLDVHKHYLVAYGVDRDQHPVYGPRRVEYADLEAWLARDLRPSDAVALEMTTNTWQMVDLLEPCVHSVTVVHPPEVKAIVKARVMTDKKAARILAQLPGIGLVAAMTLLGAIGDISRFPTATQLVGYAGLGAQVHDSGQAHWSGRITKAGRRDIRRVMVDAASHAVQMKGHWREVYERLKPRLGRPKALVAVVRKLLIAVWHVLTEATADRFATPEQVAAAFYALAYKMGVRNLPAGVGARQFVRDQLDRLGLGGDITHIPWGSKRFRLPPSRVGESAG